MKKMINILHLEDDEKDAILIQETINSELTFCKIKRVDNKADFVESLKKETFDLILSDFALPSFNGLDALSIAKEMVPDVPYIYVSGHIGEERAIEALKMGATDYVLKDKPAKLIPAINRALREMDEIEKRRQAELALKESERFSRSTLDSIRYPLSVINESGEIIFVNRSWEENSIVESPLPQGLKVGDNYLEKCRSNADALKFTHGIMSVMNGISKEYLQEYSCSLSTGVKWFIGIANKFEGNGPVRIIVSHADITELKSAEERVKKYSSQLETVISVEQNILSAHFDIENIMNLILNNAQKITQADGASISVIDNGAISFRMSSGIYNDFKSLKLSLLKSLAGYTYKTGEFIICQDIEKDERVDKESAKIMGIHSLLVFPLIYNNKIVGVLNIAYKTPNAIKEEYISLMKLLLVFLASAMSLAEKFEANKKLTEEKTNALELLKESEELYRNLFESAPIGIARVAPEGMFLDSNSTMKKLLGYSENELLQMNIYDITCEEDKNLSQEKVLQTISPDADVVNFEKRYIHKNGNIIWVNLTSTAIRNDKGDIIYFITMVENINDKKVAELALRESEKKYRMLFEKNLAGVFTSTLDGKVTSCNQTFADIYGYSSPEEIYKLNANQLYFNSEDRKKHIYKIIEMKELRNHEVCFKKKNGEEVWVLQNVELGQNEDGKSVSIFGILLDITERKIAEAEILWAKERAEEMSRLKSNFLANMSHELRTPLIGILGFSQILNDELTNKDQKEMTETILNSGNRLLETLNLILDLSRIESDKIEVVPEPFDAIETIKEILKLLKNVADKKGLSLSLLSEHSSLEVKLDKKIFTEIIENIVNNAVKFTLKGKVVVQIEKENYADKNTIVIKVIDTGIGIPKESINYIFNEFRQVSEGYSRKFEGSGLGLTITKKYVDRLGGEIFVESEEGKGSIFTVRLPVDLYVNDAAGNPEIQTSQKMGLNALNSHHINPSEKNVNLEMENKRLNILLVEDDETSQLLTGMYLKAKFDVDTASNAKDAIQKSSLNKYDIILMDINLGAGMNGTDAAKEIRKNTVYKTIPIIAITAYAMKGDKEKFLAAGLSNYLSKPFTKAQLLNIIDESLR